MIVFLYYVRSQCHNDCTVQTILTLSTDLLCESDDLRHKVNLQSHNVAFALMMCTLDAKYAARHRQLLGLYLKQHSKC